MSRFNEVFSKLTEELDSTNSSEEMINKNTTTLNSMGFATSEPGQFSSEERTDLGNVDINRAEQPDENGDYESDKLTKEKLHSDDNSSEEVTIIATDNPESCDDLANSLNADDMDDVLAKQILGVSSVTFESKFLNSFNRIMMESDYVGVKDFNHDLRVTANQVLRRLKAELPSAVGLHVDQDIDKNQNNIFLVSGPDWEKQGIKLPKTLDVENVKLKLLPEKDLYRFVYVIDDTNSDYPIIK